MVSFSGIKVLPNINQKYPIHCSVFIHLRPECLFPYSWKGALPLFTFFASIYSSIFPSFASLCLFWAFQEGLGRHLMKKNRFFLNFIFFVLLFSVLFVVFFFFFFSWLLLTDHYALGFFVEQSLEDNLLATSVMSVATSAWPFEGCSISFSLLSSSYTYSLLHWMSVCLGDSQLSLAEFLWNGLLFGCFYFCPLEQWKISCICDLLNSRCATCMFNCYPPIFFDLLSSYFSRYLSITVPRFQRTYIRFSQEFFPPSSLSAPGHSEMGLNFMIWAF